LAAKAVLVVDDHDAVRVMLGHALTQSGIASFLAKSGDQAVWLFKQHHEQIGCVLLDVNMRGLDGVATFRALRTLSSTVPIAFVTGDSSPYAVQELEALEPVEIFGKPLPLGEVIELAQRFV